MGKQQYVKYEKAVNLLKEGLAQISVARSNKLDWRFTVANKDFHCTKNNKFCYRLSKANGSRIMSGLNMALQKRITVLDTKQWTYEYGIPTAKQLFIELGCMARSLRG